MTQHRPRIATNWTVGIGHAMIPLPQTTSGAVYMIQRCSIFVLAVSFLHVAQARAADPAKLELKKGDHICVIGNTLAERMQHDGWLETLIQARFPEHELVFRDLGYSADEVRLDRRLRSLNFGTPDEWLSGISPSPHQFPGSPENRFALTNTKAD